MLIFVYSQRAAIMPYGKLITRFTTGGHDIFITCSVKSMHLEPFGLSVHAFCGTGDENIIPTCRSAGNYYVSFKSNLGVMYDSYVERLWKEKERRTEMM